MHKLRYLLLIINKLAYSLPPSPSPNTPTYQPLLRVYKEICCHKSFFSISASAKMRSDDSSSRMNWLIPYVQTAVTWEKKKVVHQNMAGIKFARYGHKGHFIHSRMVYRLYHVLSVQTLTTLANIHISSLWILISILLYDANQFPCWYVTSKYRTERP